LKAVPSTKSRISSSFIFLLLRFRRDARYAQFSCRVVMRLLKAWYSQNA
jgi:hypothetical protein